VPTLYSTVLRDL
jgi:hypothetical protein